MSCECGDISIKSHPINNSHKMSHIDIDSICTEYLVHFFENGSSCCFYSVYFPNSKDIVTLYSFMVHGCNMFDMIEINAFGVNSKLISFDSYVYKRYMFRSFYGCVHCLFSILKEVFGFFGFCKKVW